MMIVEQGKIAEFCAEPGEFTYDSLHRALHLPAAVSARASGRLFKNIGKRFTFGGDAPKDQRVYYFNTKELVGNKYGTPSPVPFRVVDNDAGLDIDIAIRCFGEYSYQHREPACCSIRTSAATWIVGLHPRQDRQPAQDRASHRSAARVRQASPTWASAIAPCPATPWSWPQALNEVLSAKWRDLRGIEIVVLRRHLSVKASEEDEAMHQGAAAVPPSSATPAWRRRHLVGAQAQAMQDAAKN